jgi:NAD(P)-dependent dehydrogenase (short-subunit alcohol dehydrogenase family)
VDRALQEGAQDAVFISTDVVALDRVAQLMRDVVDRYGRIDVLVNNVGGGGVVENRPFWETTPEDWKIDIDLTLTSVLNCARAALPHMIAAGPGGRIISIGSTSGITGDIGMAVYSAAKGGVHAFTRILAREVAEHGITVNAVAPWGIAPDDPVQDTSTGSRWHPEHGKFTRLVGSRPGTMETLKTMSLLGAPLDHPFVKPAEVGAAAVYLASDAASFITGQTLVVDGGYLLNHMPSAALRQAIDPTSAGDAE